MGTAYGGDWQLVAASPASLQAAFPLPAPRVGAPF